jgi:tryptophan-rich sensory protein
LAWAVVVAGLGGALTQLGSWYRELKRPPLQPPDWAFGPAWTVIFALTCIAGVIAWQSVPDGPWHGWIVCAFLVNGALNIGWNLLFFTLRRPDWALMEVAFLWLSIVIPMVAIAPVSAASALLLVPYAIWVGFASYLNAGIVRLNRPFETRSLGSRRP